MKYSFLVDSSSFIPHHLCHDNFPQANRELTPFILSAFVEFWELIHGPLKRGIKTIIVPYLLAKGTASGMYMWPNQG